MPIIERPYNCSLSLNDIRYVFQLADLQRPGLRLQVKLLAAGIGDDFSEVYTFLLQPAADGIAYLYVQEYLNSLLSYVLPAEDVMITNAEKQLCLFTIHFRELSDGVATPAYDTTEEDTILYAMKGGIEKHLHSRNNYFKYWENNSYPFLTWQPGNRFVDKDENIFLTFLNPAVLNKAVGNLLVWLQYTDVEGTEGLKTYPVDDTPLLFHIKLNIATLDLRGLLPGKLYKMIVTMLNSIEDNTAELAPYPFYFEYRPVYNKYDLVFHNSLGGLGFVRVKGDTVESFDRAVQEASAGKNVQDAFAPFIAPEDAQPGILLQRKFKGDVGYLRDKQQQYSLMELLASTSIYMRMAFRYVPVNALQKSQELGMATSRLNSFPVEWSLSESNEVYTPITAALLIGDASMALAAVCANVTDVNAEGGADEEGGLHFFYGFQPVPDTINYIIDVYKDDNFFSTQPLTITDAANYYEDSIEELEMGDYYIIIKTVCSPGSQSSGATSTTLHLPPVVTPPSCPNITTYEAHLENGNELHFSWEFPGGAVTQVEAQLWKDGVFTNSYYGFVTPEEYDESNAFFFLDEPGTYFVKFRSYCSGTQSLGVDSQNITYPSDARFGTTEFISGDAFNDFEIAHVAGLPNAVLTVKVTQYTNTNGGQLKANSSNVYLNNTFTVTLDGNGNGSFTADIYGAASPPPGGSIIFGRFTIIASSDGDISGTNQNFQTSKAF